MRLEICLYDGVAFEGDGQCLKFEMLIVFAR